MPSDVRAVEIALARHQRRHRMAATATAVLLGAAAAGLTLALGWAAGISPFIVRGLSVAVLAATTVAAAAAFWRGCTLARVALATERRLGQGDNVVVTAAEVAGGRTREPHPVVRNALFAAAAERLSAAPLLSLWPPLTMATAAVAAYAVLVMVLPSRIVQAPAAGEPSSATAIAPAAGDLRVVVTPPAYAERAPVEHVNPTSLTVLEGSRVDLVLASAGRVDLLDASGTVRAFQADGAAQTFGLVASASQPFVVRETTAQGIRDRLFALQVEPDTRPVVRIEQPAKDLMFAEPRGQIGIEIDARDDVGLRSIALKYTRVSGSGETFAFSEGEWPLVVERRDAGEWRARATLSLDKLALQDGDTLVYRAVAADGKPGADPSASESFLVEIGALSGMAATGFALPEDRDRQAISQQMVIIKTERLHAERSTLAPDAVAEQARLLAVEQRMVKAEFVFMTGGEVEDEVAEAEHAHELAEGRLENTAQIELLTAIREMSRAEARLNDADTARALEHERAALKALQRAFDRRRYLLRTLPERTRIDLSRRLSGERPSGRSVSRTPPSPDPDPSVERARQLLRDLSAADAGSLSLLASRVIALDPSSTALQAAAVRLSAAAGDAARADAVKEAQQAVLAILRQRLADGLPLPVRRDPLTGRIAEELADAPRGRR